MANRGTSPDEPDDFARMLRSMVSADEARASGNTVQAGIHDADAKFSNQMMINKLRRYQKPTVEETKKEE